MTGLSLTDGQIKKIIIAANKQTSVTIRLTKDSLHGSHKLPLTQTQINRISKAAEGSSGAKRGLNVTLSYAQIKHIKKLIQKTGGFIPLLSLIPIIASALGAAGGVAGGVASAVSAVKNANAATAAQEELQRHNREIEKQLGAGVVSEYVGKVPVIGNYLKPILQKLGLGISDYNKVINGGCAKCGDGLFLRPYGAGLYLGPR
jgi:hypothetical protein